MILIELKKREGCIMYQDHLADEKETFSPLKGKIIFRDFLAIAIARNTKAMRTIDDLYYSDEKKIFRSS